MTPVMETPSLAAMQAAAPPGSEQRSLQLVGIEWQQGLARLSGDNIPDAVEGMKVRGSRGEAVWLPTHQL